MTQKNPSKFAKFLKGNFYYLLIGTTLIVVALIITFIMLTNKGDNNLVDNSNSSLTTDTDSTSDTDSNTDEPDNPAGNVILFIMPVENSTISKQFTSDTVVFNSTLGVYTGHMGMDFSAPEGTNCLSVYDGVIEKIETSYLLGTTVTIDHGDSLKTVYNSIIVNDKLKVGDEICQGDIIGTVSTTNRQEYKDGAHLHFEVWENGEAIDPETYLLSEEK